MHLFQLYMWRKLCKKNLLHYGIPNLFMRIIFIKTVLLKDLHRCKCISFMFLSRPFASLSRNSLGSGRKSWTAPIFKQKNFFIDPNLTNKNSKWKAHINMQWLFNVLYFIKRSCKKLLEIKRKLTPSRAR